MQAIYEPKGLALEYAPLACNLYKGCQHGCLYCYAPLATRTKRDEFANGGTLRHGIIDALVKDAGKLSGTDDRVLFCFTSDPYQPHGSEPTRDALAICTEHGLPYQVLTKGGTRAARDFDIMGRGDCLFGSTVSFADDNSAKQWEPVAASISDRVDAIRQAHAEGIPTWISVEPVIDPQQALLVIERFADVVDYWKIGKWNHDKRANEIDWQAFAETVHGLLKSAGASFYFKRELAAYLPEHMVPRRETDEWQAKLSAATSRRTTLQLF